MASPLNTVAQTISASLSGVFFASTLGRHTTGTIVDPADPPAPTLTNHACRALIDEYSNRLRLEGLVEDDDRQVLILAKTLAVAPIAGDTVSINEGPHLGQTFVLTTPIMTDPARAVWVCRGKVR